MELPVELKNKRKDCDFYHLKVDAKIYKHFRSSDSNTSRADKEQEEKQLQEHRVVHALTKARTGCQSEKKKLFDFLIHSCKKFVDLRKIQGEGFISPKMWRVVQR